MFFILFRLLEPIFVCSFLEFYNQALTRPKKMLVLLFCLKGIISWEIVEMIPGTAFVCGFFQLVISIVRHQYYLNNVVRTHLVELNGSLTT